jgi:hypothetical protein
MNKEESSVTGSSRYLKLAASCEKCRAEVEMLTAFEAAAMIGVSCYTIYRLADSGVIHCRVTTKGVLFICPNSLAQKRGPQN